jgi:hypothetical protein
MKFKYQLSDFVWILYPVLVVGLILAGVNFLTNSGLDSFSSLTVDQAQVETDKRRVQDLETKLEVLKTVDINLAKVQLETLLEAVPASRQVWLLINELKVIGQRSEMILASYKGRVGNVNEASESAEISTASAQIDKTGPMVLEVKYKPESITPLAKALEISERLEPLVKISKINYLPTNTDITFEGAWATWPPANKNPESELTFKTVKIKQALDLLEGYEIPELDWGATPVPASTGAAILSD